ncbi:MAG: hypothetical protein OEY38_19475 [Gammaproteobacteria bacterium]|nr:hypothetical protein [Gammaproteobacteria bacterium]
MKIKLLTGLILCCVIQAVNAGIDCTSKVKDVYVANDQVFIILEDGGGTSIDSLKPQLQQYALSVALTSMTTNKYVTTRTETSADCNTVSFDLKGIYLHRDAKTANY